MAATDILSAYAASLGAKPAVIDDRPGRPVLTWSFVDLNREANRLAHFLGDCGGHQSQVG